MHASVPVSWASPAGCRGHWGKHSKLRVVSGPGMGSCSTLVKRHRWFHSWSWIDFALLAATLLVIIIALVIS